MRTDIFTITCNCGNAKSYSESKIRQLVRAVHEELYPNTPTPNIRFPEQYRITKLQRDSSYNEVKQIAERCGAWEFASRPQAGSDKILILPDSNSFIDLRQELSVIIELKGKELIELYEKTII